MAEREQSVGEEIANSVSHGVALLGALVVVPILVIVSVQRGGGARIVGASVFGATTILLYLTSTIYHALPRSRAKAVFRILDHGAIFLLIAGTYTPFTLGVLRGTWGWTIFGLAWGLAVSGIVLKSVIRTGYRNLSTAFYLAMGWMALIAIKPFWNGVPAWGLFWILAGGMAYTIGVAFFLGDRLRYGHLVWHLFVIAGTTCHYIAVLWYAA
jgi:hemolysin III